MLDKKKIKEKLEKERDILLEQMKENYTAQDDPLVKQYFAAAAQFPDKERLCYQYLQVGLITPHF